MPVDASIPLQIKPPNAIGKISDILGVQRQQTALASERQSLQQRRGIADFDVSKIIGDDGTIDLNKVPGSGLREAAGDQFPEVLQQYMTVKQQQLAAKQSLVQVTNAQRQSFGEMMGALRGDDDVVQDSPEGRQKVVQAFGQYANMYGKDVEGVLKAYAAPIQHAPPGKLGDVLKNIQLQATSADSQATRQTPNFQQVNTGSQLERVQTNPNAPGGADIPQKMDLTIAPGQQSQQTTDQLGNFFVQDRDAKGNIIGYRPVQGGPASFGAGERTSLETQANTNFEAISRNREAARSAPQQRDQIRKARELSKSVSTGEWAQKRAKIESGLSSLIPGLDSADNDATKLQLLDKFAERIAADAAPILGQSHNTDAARESVRTQNANIGYTPKAVQAVLDYAEAQTDAVEAKGNAQEKWLKKEGNGITKAHDFETKWRQAYDPVLFQMKLMDQKEANEFAKKLPKAERESLKKKHDELVELGAL